MILLYGLLVSPHASVASMGVLIQTATLIYIFLSSLSFKMSTHVGNKLGARNPQRAKLETIVDLCFNFVFGLSTLAFAVHTRWGSHCFDDHNVINYWALRAWKLSPDNDSCSIQEADDQEGFVLIRLAR